MERVFLCRYRSSKSDVMWNVPWHRTIYPLSHKKLADRTLGIYCVELGGIQILIPPNLPISPQYAVLPWLIKNYDARLVPTLFTASVQVFGRTLYFWYLGVFLKSPHYCRLQITAGGSSCCWSCTVSAGGVETVGLIKLGAKCILTAVCGWLFRKCILRLEVFPSLMVTFYCTIYTLPHQHLPPLRSF